MSNSVETKLTVKTDEGIANVGKLGDAMESLSRRSVRAAEAQVKATAANTRATQELIRVQQIANMAAGADGPAKAAQEATEAIGKASKAAHEFSLANAGMSRELLVMFHEGITGNFKRMAGSAVVMGERMNALQYIFSGAGLAIGAAAAAVGALAVATEEGYKQDETFRKSMILTGGAAGVTTGQFHAMALAIASETGRAVAAAQEALQSLVKSGQVAPQNLAKMGTAIVQIAHLTGESTTEVAKQFDDMSADVVGWINRHKEYANSLTAAQLEAIRNLQKTDDVQGAVGATLDAINKKTQDSVGFWSKLGTAASNAWAAMGKGMGGTNTPEDKLAEMQQRLQDLQHSGARGAAPDWSESAGRGRTLGDERDGLKAGIAAQQAQVAAGQQQAALKGTQQATENAAKAADQHLHSMLDEARGAAALAEALRVARAEFAAHDAARKQDNVTTPDWLTPEARQEMLAKIRKAHTSSDERKDDSAFTTTMKQLTDEDAKIKALTASYTANSRAVGERAAVLQARFRDQDDPASKWTPGQKATAMTKATTTDSDAGANQSAEAVRKIEDQLRVYGQLTAAKETDAKAAFVAQAVASHDAELSKLSTDALKQQLTAEIALAAAKKFDADAAVKYADDAKKRQDNVAAEIAGIARESEALHQTTLQREIAADAAKLQKAAEEEMRTHAGEEVAIQAALAQNIAAVTAARTAQYNDSRSAPTGASNAATKWAEDASNAGALAAKMTTSSLDTVSSALTKLAETGQFSFKKLWKSMSDEFLANIIRMQVANAASGAGNLFGSIFSSLSGGANLSGSGVGGDAGAGNYTSAGLAAAFGIAGMRATGGNVNSGGKYITGELGPELFVPSGSGTIIPNDALGGGSGGDIHIGANPTYNIGAGTSRAEVAAAVAQGNKQTLAAVQRLSSTGKLRQ